ncbi:hypothetical protein D9M68_525930 [compost metagenome]
MRMRSPSRVLGASIAKVPALATVNPEEAARLGNDQDTPKLTASDFDASHFAVESLRMQGR